MVKRTIFIKQSYKWIRDNVFQRLKITQCKIQHIFMAGYWVVFIYFTSTVVYTAVTTGSLVRPAVWTLFLINLHGRQTKSMIIKLKTK